MQIFLLAVIIRQLAIICIALMIYGIYRLWNPNVTPLHLKPLTISISITILIVIIASLLVKWFILICKQVHFRLMKKFKNV